MRGERWVVGGTHGLVAFVSGDGEVALGVLGRRDRVVAVAQARRLQGRVGVLRCAPAVAGTSGPGVERHRRAVADVLLAVLDADEQPAHAAAHGLDQVPRVHGVYQGADAHRTAARGLVLVLDRGAAADEIRRGVERRGRAGDVGPEGKGPEVEEGEEGHLDADEQAGDADLEVALGQLRAGLHGGDGRRADGEQHRLPQHKEDDQLDGQDLAEELVLGQGVLQLDVDLDDAHHGNGDGHHVDGADPDVGKGRVVGALAVDAGGLGRHADDARGDACEAVLVDGDPADVEPRQAALRRAPGPALATAAAREALDGPGPGLDGRHGAEELLLRVDVRGDVVADEGEEGGQRECLVALRDDLEVDGVFVEEELEQRRDAVHGDHEEDADDVSLLARLGVVEGVPPDEVEADEDGDGGRGGADDVGEFGEGEAADDGFLVFRRAHVLQRRVALWTHDGGFGGRSTRSSRGDSK